MDRNLLRTSLAILMMAYVHTSIGGTLITTGFDRATLDIDLRSRNIRVWVDNNSFETVKNQVRQAGQVQAFVSTSAEARSACETGEISNIETKFSWTQAELDGRYIKISGLEPLERPEGRQASKSHALTIFVRARISGEWSCAWMTDSFSATEKQTFYNLFRQDSTRRSRLWTNNDVAAFDGIFTAAKHTLILDPVNNEIRFKGADEISRFQTALKRAKMNLKIKFGLALHGGDCGDSVKSGSFKSIPVQAKTRNGFISIPLAPFAKYVDFQANRSLGFVFYPDPKVDNWQCAYFDLDENWGFNRNTLVAINNFEDSPSISGDPLIDEELLGLFDEVGVKEKNTSKQDGEPPTIVIASAGADGARGVVSGVVTDQSGIAEITVNGNEIIFDADGEFRYATYVPNEGIEIKIKAIDFTGLSTTETVRLARVNRTPSASRLAAVNPLLGPKQSRSRDRAALIIGLEDYAVSEIAKFASRDAQVFADYATEKLAVPADNVKVLVDSGATEREILRALKVWLPTVIEPDATDLYVFYAGHGMPTADGSSAYLVPYDGDVQLLEDTAISRTRFFNEIGKARPRSATFFFDNCFSGATRSEELLLASRPLGIEVTETGIPENYLVFTAGESNQTAGVLDQVKHGRFSYFVFKGLEGEADANQDRRISAGELHHYVRESVGRFSAGAQTPTMLGDADKWVLQ